MKHKIPELKQKFEDLKEKMQYVDFLSTKFLLLAAGGVLAIGAVGTAGVFLSSVIVKDNLENVRNCSLAIKNSESLKVKYNNSLSNAEDLLIEASSTSVMIDNVTFDYPTLPDYPSSGQEGGGPQNQDGHLQKEITKTKEALPEVKFAKQCSSSEEASSINEKLKKDKPAINALFDANNALRSDLSRYVEEGKIMQNQLDNLSNGEKLRADQNAKVQAEADQREAEQAASEAAEAEAQAAIEAEKAAEEKKLRDEIRKELEKEEKAKAEAKEKKE